MNKITEVPEGAVADAKPETAKPSDPAACIRANVAAFRSADNASMMGGWTN